MKTHNHSHGYGFLVGLDFHTLTHTCEKTGGKPASYPDPCKALVILGGSVVDDGFAVDGASGVVHTRVAEDIKQVEEGNDQG